jgi:hypothetical protein
LRCKGRRRRLILGDSPRRRTLAERELTVAGRRSGGGKRW